nr:uncharacterized protein LOC107034161 isoform X2 [Vicugna pacos]
MHVHMKCVLVLRTLYEKRESSVKLIFFPVNSKRHLVMSGDMSVYHSGGGGAAGFCVQPVPSRAPTLHGSPASISEQELIPKTVVRCGPVCSCAFFVVLCGPSSSSSVDRTQHVLSALALLLVPLVSSAVGPAAGQRNWFPKACLAPRRSDGLPRPGQGCSSDASPGHAGLLMPVSFTLVPNHEPSWTRGRPERTLEGGRWGLFYCL